MSKNMNSEKELVSIIILNYNGNEFLENCIESIFRETEQKFELIIVDNNSPDKSGEKFSKILVGTIHLLFLYMLEINNLTILVPQSNHYLIK